MRSLCLLFLSIFFWQCQSENKPITSAFLGGQIIHPSNNFINLYKNNKPFDSLYLDDNNRFEKTCDFAEVGLIRFEHLPETQSLLLEAGDSIWLRANMADFQASVVFSGRGSSKNNFLANQMLDHENERSFLAGKYPLSSMRFRHIIDSLQKIKNERYSAFLEKTPSLTPLSQKVLKASNLYPYANRLERYVLIRGKAAIANDSSYYDFRKKIDYNQKELAFYEPYITYLMSYLSHQALPDGVSFMKAKKTTAFNHRRLALIAEQIKDSTLRNVLARSVAYEELLNFDNHLEHSAFLKAVFAVNTSTENKKELIDFHRALQQMSPGYPLPIIELQTHESTKIPSSIAFSGQKTVLYFWSQTQMNHFKRIQNRVAEYQKKFPHIRFVGLCIQPYNNMVRDYQNIMDIDPKDQYALVDFERVSASWVITALNKGILIDENGKIVHGFGNFMGKDFEAQLAKIDR